MNNLIAVVVQIIGLAVLRTEPQLGGMHVVLPSIMDASNVEPHSAILVFKDDMRVEDGSDWTIFQLKPMPGYSYVKLTGERIRFIVNGMNVSAKIPAGLPHLQASCSLMRDLSEGYQPPAYGAAAAVVMIPNGTSSACRNQNGRIDARVTMVNTGNFLVVACNKSITFHNEAVVMIVNVPTAWVEAEEVDPNALKHDALHSRVYFHMARMPPDARKTCELPRSENVEPCNSPRADAPIVRRPPIVRFLHRPNPGTPQTPHDSEVPIFNTTFQCSATQWP